MLCNKSLQNSGLKRESFIFKHLQGGWCQLLWPELFCSKCLPKVSNPPSGRSRLVQACLVMVEAHALATQFYQSFVCTIFLISHWLKQMPLVRYYTAHSGAGTVKSLTKWQIQRKMESLGQECNLPQEGINISTSTAHYENESRTPGKLAKITKFGLPPGFKSL